MTKRIQLIVFGFLILTAQTAFADSLANCSNPEGHGYFLAHGLVNEASSGWKKEKITDGSVTLSKTEAGYDILFIDATKNIISSTGEGSKVMLMSHSQDDAIFLVAASGGIEVYKFFQDSTGAKKYAFTTTRNNFMPIAKISIMVGDCSFINFESIK